MRRGMQPAAVQAIPPKVVVPTGPLPPSTVSSPSRMTDEELIEAVAQRVVEKLDAREVHFVPVAQVQVSETSQEIAKRLADEFDRERRRQRLGWA